MPAPQSPPDKAGGPPDTWRHRALYDRVISALHALPARFVSALVIEGVPATDLFTMNTPLGAAIEISVVDSLNALRDVWDPDNEYASYAFVRQGQTFPDVLLRAAEGSVQEPILMGIELKGWFAIAKEGEPSYRYLAAADACASADLLVVVPWIFDSVVSGKPRLLQPIVTEARYAAQMRNYYWEFVRASQESVDQRGVRTAQNVRPYPRKNEQYLDRPIADGGGNFGRIARCGVMDKEIRQVLEESALGIPLDAWSKFLRIFNERSSRSEIETKLAALEQSMAGPPIPSEDVRIALLGRIREAIDSLLSAEGSRKRSRQSVSRRRGGPSTQ